MSDLGNLGRFLKEGSVSNLDWLEIDPAEYRAQSVLPKQNLDIQPDLQAIWSHDDLPASKYIENRGAVPHTMGDLSQEHGHLRAKPDDIVKVARLALMQSSDLAKFKDTLLKRFDVESLRTARPVLASVLAERGLLGSFYIAASDFPQCSKHTSRPAEFVKRYAGDARYVLAKPACAGCVHKHATVAGETCAVFHKEIRFELPYTEALAVEVEQLQRAKGKNVQASSDAPKERIRLALLADDVVVQETAPLFKPKDAVARLLRPVEVQAAYQKTAKEIAQDAIGRALAFGKLTALDAQSAYNEVNAATDEEALKTIEARVAQLSIPEHFYQPVGQRGIQTVSAEAVDTQLIEASALLRKKHEAAQQLVAGDKRQAAQQEKIHQPIVALLRREMLKGRGKAELISILKQAAQSTDIEAARASLAPLLNEVGLYGVIYSTQESFDDCREGSNFFATHNPGVRGIVAGAKCTDCIYSKIGRCLMYGKPLVKAASDLYTSDTVEKVAMDHHAAGYSVSGEGKDTRSILASMHNEVRTQALRNQQTPAARAAHMLAQAHVMNQSLDSSRASTLTEREIVKTARRFLNEGLYGKDLLSALKSQFDPRDLVAASQALKPVLAEQGLQGIHYVDPSVYADYGKGCKEAARLHRNRLVPYVKVASKCASCVHQVRAGFWSVVHKPLVEEPPYVDKKAQQREVLASGAATRIDLKSLVNNGASMMAEYQMQNGGLNIELQASSDLLPVGVEFNNQAVKL